MKRSLHIKQKSEMAFFSPHIFLTHIFTKKRKSEKGFQFNAFIELFFLYLSVANTTFTGNTRT